jgi:predicted nucleic acid-binding protein
MKTVIDTSPLISLGVIDQLLLLDELFPTIIVPQAVHLEIEAAASKTKYAKIIEFIKTRINHVQNEHRFQFNLGKGEMEAICLSLELGADILIIDDRKARNAAESLKIKCIGTLGLLTLAKKKGLIGELRKYFNELIENDRYFSVELLNRILQSNQESHL